MRRNLESQRRADGLGLNIRWIVLTAAALMVLPLTKTPVGIGLVGMFVAANVLAYRLCREDNYQDKGTRFALFLRIADVAAITAICFFMTPKGDNLWLLAVPSLLAQALIYRSFPEQALIMGVALASPIVAGLTGRENLAYAGESSLGLIGASMMGLVLASYQGRDEKLKRNNLRLQSVLDCASALADSSELRNMILHTLKSAVTELDARCGYVMLTDEESKGNLKTELAFSPTGEFKFPETLELGTGITGYAVKMGQPIAIHNNQGEQFDYEGIDLDARSAMSVPLIARNYTGAGQASVEQILGAITLLSNDEKSFASPEDVELLRSLSSLVAVAVANYRMEERQRTTFLKTLESLAKSLEARDTYTRGHSQRVCDVSLMIGEHLGFGPEALEELRVGTILHDIGKIGVPDHILNKPGRLTDEEFAVMKSHPVIGYEICRPLMLSEGVLMIIRNHHEKLDGGGYPDGLKGGELPLSLRIVCVADAFDAMSSRRPYRNVMDMNNVLAELSRGAGVQFDPVVVESLKDLLPTPRMQDCYRSQWGDEEIAA